MSILTDSDRDFFEANGYIVVPDVVPKENCEAVIDTLFEFLGMDRDNVDTSKLPTSFGVQAVLSLTDTEPGMGGFTCVPGFHRGLEEWIKTQPADRNPRVPDLSALPPDKKVTPIPAKAGSITIWNNILL